MPVAVGLGSNLGDRLGHLRSAVRALDGLLGDLRCSPVYETAPSLVEDQPMFLNACCTGTCNTSARRLLADLQGLEREAGRQCGGRYGPRTLDLDLLLYGEQCIEELHLVVPHPRLRERPFVLVPLADVAGDWVVPGRPGEDRATAARLAASASREGVVPTDLALAPREHA